LPGRKEGRRANQKGKAKRKLKIALQIKIGKRHKKKKERGHEQKINTNALLASEAINCQIKKEGGKRALKNCLKTRR